MGETANRIWGMVDGSISVSGSMLLAVLINNCQSCVGIWVIGFLKELSDKSAGVIVLATLLLFPTTLFIYGGLKMWFAAKEAVEKKAKEKGRQEERERIGRSIGEALKQRGTPLSPEEITRILAGEPAPRS